jgi:hypothetical protein
MEGAPSEYFGKTLFRLILGGGGYHDYGILSRILSVDRVEVRSLGILGVEIGVALGVMAVMCTILFCHFYSSRKNNRSNE